ncbi:MAG: hypothetical protein HC809_04055 [Gammaproteobacteria bacterium]|nr:hypothetical protein [Gammaproteobacteria bacterium]
MSNDNTCSYRANRSQVLRIGAAVLLAALGLIGLVIPIIPGIPLLIVAAVIFSTRLPVERSAARNRIRSGLNAWDTTKLAGLRAARNVVDRLR